MSASARLVPDAPFSRRLQNREEYQEVLAYDVVARPSVDRKFVTRRRKIGNRLIG